MTIETIAIETEMIERTKIELLFPVWIDVYMAVDKVWVLPEIFPATIIVAPNSLIERINPKNNAEIRPVFIIGKITYKKVLFLSAPKILDVLIISLSTESIVI